jgi:hypothetical protein
MNAPVITAETGDPIGLLLDQRRDIHPLSYGLPYRLSGKEWGNVEGEHDVHWPSQ